MTDKQLEEIAEREYFKIPNEDKKKMTEDKRNVLRLAKDGEGTCLDCEWGTCLFGGNKGAVCLHTGKKNINELTRCEKWKRQK